MKRRRSPTGSLWETAGGEGLFLWTPERQGTEPEGA